MKHTDSVHGFAELTPEDSKKYLESHPEGSFTLLDVRQVHEYESDRIPGARLIPLPELPEKLAEISREKPILVYCASGGRSRAASQLLTGSGFHPVYNLAGGMNAWEGSAAEGPMEMGMAMIRGDESPGEIIRTAHMMEKALGDFYRFCASRTRNPKVAALFELLEKIEKKHQGRLEEMARLHAVDGIGAEASPPSEILEGGFEREDFLKRVDAYMEAPLQIMEIAMMMEAQALDLYLRFSQKVETSEVKKILFDLADEEKGHLKRLGTLMDELLNG